MVDCVVREQNEAEGELRTNVVRNSKLISALLKPYLRKDLLCSLLSGKQMVAFRSHERHLISIQISIKCQFKRYLDLSIQIELTIGNYEFGKIFKARK
jgi:hypothetical protein